MISGGTPSFSFPNTNTILSGNTTSRKSWDPTVCSSPTSDHPSVFNPRKYPGKPRSSTSFISTHSSAVTLVYLSFPRKSTTERNCAS